MTDDKLPLILLPGSGIVRTDPHVGRIVGQMVNDALALTRALQANDEVSIHTLSSVVSTQTTLKKYSLNLTELDLSHFPHVTILECYNNKLTELDLSPVPQLTELGCGKNGSTRVLMGEGKVYRFG